MSDQVKTAAGAIWSLVLGILSFTCFGPLGSIPAIICGHVARSKIKAAGGELKGEGLALAGLILGYVSLALMILLLPLYAAVAIPSFVKARDVAQRNACINNMRMIDSAKEQAAIELNYDEGSAVGQDELLKYLPNKTWPVCPKGGRYTVNPVGREPACSAHGAMSQAASRAGPGRPVE